MSFEIDQRKSLIENLQDSIEFYLAEINREKILEDFMKSSMKDFPRSRDQIFIGCEEMGQLPLSRLLSGSLLDELNDDPSKLEKQEELIEEFLKIFPENMRGEIGIAKRLLHFLNQNGILQLLTNAFQYYLYQSLENFNGIEVKEEQIKITYSIKQQEFLNITVSHPVNALYLDNKRHCLPRNLLLISVFKLSPGSEGLPQFSLESVFVNTKGEDQEMSITSLDQILDLIEEEKQDTKGKKNQAKRSSSFPFFSTLSTQKEKSFSGRRSAPTFMGKRK